MKLSVIIPCYNEEKTIGTVLHAVRGSGIQDLEIIVVDDGSSDSTARLLRGELEPLWDQLILAEENRGKGAAVKAGFDAATGDLFLIQDADLEYDPAVYPDLIQPILDGKADAVFGSRFIGAAPHRVLYFWHRVGNGIITLWSNMWTNLNLTDIETGYKVIKSEIARLLELEEKRFGLEPEITAKLAKMKCRIYEVGIPYFGRTYEEGKKIGWKDGVSAIWCIVKYNTWRRYRGRDFSDK